LVGPTPGDTGTIRFPRRQANRRCRVRALGIGCRVTDSGQICHCEAPPVRSEPRSRLGRRNPVFKVVPAFRTVHFAGKYAQYAPVTWAGRGLEILPDTLLSPTLLSPRPAFQMAFEGRGGAAGHTPGSGVSLDANRTASVSSSSVAQRGLTLRDGGTMRPCATVPGCRLPMVGKTLMWIIQGSTTRACPSKCGASNCMSCPRPTVGYATHANSPAWASTSVAPWL
jgi:hypothetical protein